MEFNTKQTTNMYKTTQIPAEDLLSYGSKSFNIKVSEHNTDYSMQIEDAITREVIEEVTCLTYDQVKWLRYYKHEQYVYDYENILQASKNLKK
jgi:hypothetical protein